MANAQRSPFVEGLNKEFAMSFETRNFAPVAEMFTEDAVMLPPRRALVSGRADIESYWSRARRVKDLVFESETVTTLAGDVARDIGTFRMRLEPGRARRERLAESGEGGESQPRELAGKYVFVWRKVGSDWKVETSIWNVTKQQRGRAGRRGPGGRRRAGE
jgi:ketosteroid isomerase-like protein